MLPGARGEHLPGETNEDGNNGGQVPEMQVAGKGAEIVANINLSDLPPKYQAQALAKLAKQEQKKRAGTQQPARSKYGNVKTGRDALHFDSKKEARRFDELAAELAAGTIKDLRLQVEFTLQAAYTTPDGERVRAIRYLADFTYYRDTGGSWEYVVEDVKSKPTRTRVYLMKKKMMADRLGLDITEI